MRKSFTDSDGNRHWIRAKDEVEYEVKKALLETRIDEGRIIYDRNTLVRDWADKWLSTYKKSQEGSVWYKETERYVGYIKSFFSSTKLKDATQLKCQELLYTYDDKSQSFMDKLLLTLRQIFKKAVKNKLIHDDPTEELQKPICEEGTHRPLTDKELELVLKVAETHHAGTWIKTMLYCGLRPSETSLIRGMDVSIEKRVLSVNGTKSKAANRLVPIPEHFIDELAQFANREYVFTTQRGTKLTKRRSYHWWDSFKREMKIQMGARTFRNAILDEDENILDSLKNDLNDSPLTLYCLRHHYGTDLEMKGVPINIAKELMGHSSIEMTAKIYTHFTEKTLNLAAEYINKGAGTVKK